ncbi:hypothetical protein BU17DRAFT_86619 [Hysterangium stoloniferum]|nr:hypothetical protein BU17DRAFT_86619 [Hysterangium stoloniferum]
MVARPHTVRSASAVSHTSPSLSSTIGEGEFRKVKLGLHGKRRVEVVVQLIRRGNIEALFVSTTSSGPTSISAPPKSMPQANNSPTTSLAHRYLKESACKLSPGSYQAGTSYIQLEKDHPLRFETRECAFLDGSRKVIIDFGLQTGLNIVPIIS